MKNKKILAILTISAIVSAAATGCSFGGDEPEEQVVVTETLSRRNSRVFCELCSQKTPRGMLPVNQWYLDNANNT